MVKKIVGYDENGKVAFEREARAYDHSIVNTVFGISVSDLFRVIPVIIACMFFYVDTVRSREAQMDFNKQILLQQAKQDSTIEGITFVLANLNNYLSATTQKQFKDGRPL